ncbi:hypothetical protein, partial [Gordonia bronchialis]|uniref:hypothetical protein n=1 Tax=Gordonia bronchialis TaxID=2054 RepID=UPI00155943A9
VVITRPPRGTVGPCDELSKPSRRDRRAAAAQTSTEKLTKLPLLTIEERFALERQTTTANPLVALRAKLKLHFDTSRRFNYAKQVREQAAARSSVVDPHQQTRRGLAGEGGGRTGPVAAPVEYRGTTYHAGGLWPFPVGAGAPLVGVPLGLHLYTHAPVCFDPLSWMTRAKHIGQPSFMLLGLPSFGKSTLLRKMMLGMIATGVTALVLGDMRPDYRDLVASLDGGQVITLGLGQGTINPLDMGPLAQIVPILAAAVAERTEAATAARERGDLDGAHTCQALADLAAMKLREVRARIAGDRVRRIKGLLELTRGGEIADYEETAIRAALEVCDRRGRAEDRQPVLKDLVAVISEGPAAVREAYVADTDAEYRREAKALLRTLTALRRGSFGEVFDHETSTPIDIDAPAICIDVSGVEASDRKLKGAVLLTCWEHGFAAIAAAHFLADALCGPKRQFLAVLDEMWQVLRAGVGMVDRVDELTRLNRNIATAVAMCTHTVSDLVALPREEDRATAQGFVERVAALIVGALPRKEMDRLSDIKPFTDTEIADITSWSSPPALTGDSRTNNAPPGRGKFYIKIGEQGTPGLPFRTILTDVEIESGIHDTNRRFDATDHDWSRELAEVAA